jgi:hypothetical protein
VQQFDSASVAALLASLTQRAEGQQFSLTVTTLTSQLYTDHPAGRLVAPVSQSRSLLTWRASYRSPSYRVPVLGQGGPQGRVVGYDVFPGVSRTFGPESLVCDTASLLLAQGTLLLWAQQQFDLHDQRSRQRGWAPARVP